MGHLGLGLPPTAALGWAWPPLLLVGLTGAIELLMPRVPVLDLSMLYLLPVVITAFTLGFPRAVATSVASMLVINFFFLPPLHALTLADNRNWVALFVFVTTSLLVAKLAAWSRWKAREATVLARVATSLLECPVANEAFDEVCAELASALRVQRVSILLDAAPVRAAEGDCYAFTVAGRQAGVIVLERPSRSGARIRRRLLPALATLLAVAVDRERLALEAVEAETLRRSDSVKTAILRAVSHDLRTPLMAILTAAGALSRPGLVLEESDRTDLLATVLAETNRLDRLVSNLLELSRLEAGVAGPRTELVLVDELILGSLDGLGADTARVDVALPDDAAAVRVDVLQVQRVLANLIENALKYSAHAKRVNIRVATTSTEVLIRVIDHGPGISRSDSERVFAAFHRGGTSERVNGSGLGLAIAAGFAEANGGRVSLESRPGQGATFVLALPVSQLALST